MLKHKRTLAGILAATMMLSMAACGGGSEWTPEGDRKGQGLSMGDGEYTSLTKYAYVGTQ